MTDASHLPDLEAALKLFDETTRALDARARRLDEVLTVKQRELEEANRQLEMQLAEVHRLREIAERHDRLRALGEMAAGVAHEIRNPLNGIEGFASLLIRDVEEGSSQQRYAQSIVEGVRHLNATVSGLLEFTRSPMPNKRLVPIPELIDSCKELIAAETDVPNEAIVMENTWSGSRLACDGTQIRQVILNLLQNAVHVAGAEKGDELRICIAIAEPEESEGEGVVLSVDDNGPGVAEEDRKQIFTPFFTTREEGTGLGLSIAHNMISMHDGTLTVETSPLDGARFRLFLPA